MSAVRLALFGKPVAHSPSPRVHGAFGSQFGIDIDYQLIEAAPETFYQRLESFHASGGLGCNVTLPLKSLAFEQADEPTRRAELAGTANTLFWSGDLCHADNTDGEGLVTDIEQNLDLPITDSRILLIGAGGAAAGVLGSLLEREPASLMIANRTEARAQDLAERHEEAGEVGVLALDDIEYCGIVDLVIDATSMGRSGAQPQLPVEVLAEAEMCYSLNYGRAAGPLHALAIRAGVPFHDGLGMLVEQAACAFEIWTGKRPETASVINELRREGV